MSTNNKIAALDNIFDELIKPGQITKTKEIMPGFSITVRPLSLGELALADSIIGPENFPGDVVVKVRAAQYLSVAITAVNNIDIEKEDTETRKSLYQKILGLPAIVVQKAYEFYLEIGTEQEGIFTPKKAEDGIEKLLQNF